jgi:hypothetical protein
MFAGKWPLPSSPTVFRQARPLPSSLPSHPPYLVVVAMSDRDTGRRMEYRNLSCPAAIRPLICARSPCAIPQRPGVPSHQRILSEHSAATPKAMMPSIPERRVSVSKTCQRGWHCCGDKAARGCVSSSVGFQVGGIGDVVSCSGCPAPSEIRRARFFSAFFFLTRHSPPGCLE